MEASRIPSRVYSQAAQSDTWRHRASSERMVEILNDDMKVLFFFLKMPNCEIFLDSWTSFRGVDTLQLIDTGNHVDSLVRIDLLRG